MKFIIEKASDYHFEEEKDIKTLEELIQLAKDSNHSLVVKPKGIGITTVDTIIIYDDYLE